MVACRAPIGIPTIEEDGSEAIIVAGGALRFTFKGAISFTTFLTLLV